MSLLDDIIARRTATWDAANALLNSAETQKRGLNSVEEDEYRSLTERIDAFDQRIKDLRAEEGRAQSADTSFAQLRALPTSRPHSPEAGNALRAFMRGERGRTFEVMPDGPVDFRALVKGTPAAGGNTVQTSFYNRLMAHLIEVSGVMSAGPTVLNTSSGEDLQVPKTTAHSTAAIVTEGSAIGPSDPTFGQATLKAYKYGILIQVSRELVDDTAVDLEGYLAMQTGRALGNAFGAHAITGTGTGQPTGIVTSAATGVTGSTVAQGAAVIGAPTGDNLIDLFHSVIAPYRNSSSAAWLMRDSTIAAVRKIKDSTGQYLWQPALTDGSPGTLLGKPVYTDPNVAAVGTAAKSIIFGDFSAYFVRMAGGIRFERSDEYAFNTDQVTYRALLRSDGITVDQTGALKVFVGNTA